MQTAYPSPTAQVFAALRNSGGEACQIGGEVEAAFWSQFSRSKNSSIPSNLLLTNWVAIAKARVAAAKGWEAIAWP